MRLFRLFCCIGAFGVGSVYAAPPSLDELHEFGHRIHAMVQAYQSPEDRVNIFVPAVSTKEGNPCDYLKRKGKICVFASGGLKNAWEKTVSKAYHVLYGEEIKIIRASWVQKHLDRDLETKYAKTPQTLHTELFFKLFANKFKRGICEMKAFSWWSPCESCHDLLSTFFKDGGYEITFVKKYPSPAYESTPAFRVRKMPLAHAQVVEEKVWKDLWDQVVKVSQKPFESEVDKKTFWAENYQGICLSKWLAQVFVKTPGLKLGLEDPDLSPEMLFMKDITPYWEEVASEEQESVYGMVRYLAQVNWELSCWYKPPFPEDIQKRWVAHWKKAVVPHFNWQEVGGDEDEEASTTCEMCGYERIRHISYVYHNKHTPTQKGQPDQAYKRKKSLTVGSECVAHLILNAQQVAQSQQKALEKAKERVPKRRAEQDRKDQDEALTQAERELSKQAREEKLRLKALKQQEKEARGGSPASSRMPGERSKKRKNTKEQESRHGSGSSRGKRRAHKE